MNIDVKSVKHIKKHKRTLKLDLIALYVSEQWSEYGQHQEFSSKVAVGIQQEDNMAEPRLEDDFAFYGNERCDECGERHDPDEGHDYGDDPDRLHDEQFE